MLAWLARPAPGDEAFDIVYADPPYAEAPALVRQVLDLLPASGRLARRAVFVAEQRADAPAPEPAGWDLLTRRRYGQTGILLFRRSEEA